MTRTQWAALGIAFVLTIALTYLFLSSPPIVVAVLWFVVGAPIALYRGRRRLPRPAALGLGLVWVILVGVIWVIPTIQGPTIACTYVDPMVCDQAWQNEKTVPPIYAIFPVTYARVGFDLERGCHERHLEWWMGAVAYTVCWIYD